MYEYTTSTSPLFKTPSTDENTKRFIRFTNDAATFKEKVPEEAVGPISNMQL